MLGKLPDRNQRELFRTHLADLINPKHELALLADKIGRNIEKKFFAIFFLPLFSEKFLLLRRLKFSF